MFGLTLDTKTAAIYQEKSTSSEDFMVKESVLQTTCCRFRGSNCSAGPAFEQPGDFYRSENCYVLKPTISDLPLLHTTIGPLCTFAEVRKEPGFDLLSHACFFSLLHNYSTNLWVFNTLNTFQKACQKHVSRHLT